MEKIAASPANVKPFPPRFTEAPTIYRAGCAERHCRWAYDHSRKEIAWAHGVGHRRANDHDVMVFDETTGELVQWLRVAIEVAR